MTLTYEAAIKSAQHASAKGCDRAFAVILSDSQKYRVVSIDQLRDFSPNILCNIVTSNGPIWPVRK